MAKERITDRRTSASVTSGSNSESRNFFDDKEDNDYSSYFKRKVSSNPFDDEETETSVSHWKTTTAISPGQNGKQNSRNALIVGPYQPEEDLLSPQELYRQEVVKVQDRTLQMTQRSLKLIDESESVGVAAGQELLSQREQLQNANTNLDSMNSTLDQSQKHINHIRSIFGGLKNWWSSKSTDVAPTVTTARSDELRSCVESYPSDRVPKAVDVLPDIKSADQLPVSGRTGDHMRISADPSTPKQFEEALDTHLDQMSFGLSRLKGLAQGLGGEIEQQNQMLDSMNSKSDRVSVKLGEQQKSIDRILGKKK